MGNNVQYMGTTTQRPSESVSYAIDVADIGSGAIISTTIGKDITDPAAVTVVTGTIITGSASVSGTTISTAIVTALADDRDYRIITRFTHGGNTYERYFDVQCRQE